MPATATVCVNTLYHQTEVYFLAGSCSFHRPFSACIDAYLSNDPLSDWNLLFIRIGSPPPGEALDDCLALIRTAALSVRMAVHQDHLRQVQPSLADLGFTVGETSTAMMLDLSRRAPPPTSPRPCDIRQTNNLDVWSGPVSKAFGLSANLAADYQARHQAAIESGRLFYHFVLSVQGAAVSALTLTICDGLARLNDISTDPAFRGQGYATQLMHAALTHAAELGARQCFLEASAQGLSLYRSQGFSALFDYQTFWRGPLLADDGGATTG